MIRFVQWFQIVPTPVANSKLSNVFNVKSKLTGKYLTIWYNRTDPELNAQTLFLFAFYLFKDGSDYIYKIQENLFFKLVVKSKDCIKNNI